MSNCSEELRKEGKAYPRTCASCGFGPCRNKLKADPPPRTAETLADKILRAAGSGLRHYQTRTRDDILKAAREIMEELAK